ncbi:hypothetical protein C1H46_040633 [Malus baccata]|uniref:Uncharacterized protein n=1 Tax=Malus baccata TaxID=106549 RepID=A0A540KI27_MALBA|nr:hypothetical protein C1H46_040633 [Malus baccata]
MKSRLANWLRKPTSEKGCEAGLVCCIEYHGFTQREGLHFSLISFTGKGVQNF